MAIKRNTRVEATFTMSSMTDIVFLLLIFFLVTSTLINPNALKLLLPKSTNQISDKAQVSLSIKHYPQAGTFSYHINGNNHAVPYSEIERQLQEFLQNSDDPTVSLYVDKTVPMEQVVQVMNIAKRNQYKVILATSPE
ncbi:MAG: biopolymer transporter ExbD [Bacteroidales bacterium]|jgi:biopolymer transport protein ExbD|nr:biopolymer transporter ExbD [Bacteroidales bacterium]MDD2825029.1 biopolymer transporter ExbD [Bacteroidales bacterium]MDD3100924.1 biopolymer transporter ExbD [Bacteroidales bacterium]MDD3639849.1 biopolymer transporter ExbD [Bacteroidales bacterium]MDD3944592.1 biopolymer transporter ExbD [Bacteroidales bacterium]